MGLIKITHKVSEDTVNIAFSTTIEAYESLSSASQAALVLAPDFAHDVSEHIISLPDTLSSGANVLVKIGSEYVLESLLDVAVWASSRFYSLAADLSIAAYSFITDTAAYAWESFHVYQKGAWSGGGGASYSWEVVSDVVHNGQNCVYSASVGGFNLYTVFVDTLYIGGDKNGQRHLLIPYWAYPHHLEGDPSADLSDYVPYINQNMWNNLVWPTYSGQDFQYCHALGHTRSFSSYFTNDYSRSIMYSRGHVVTREWRRSTPTGGGGTSGGGGVSVFWGEILYPVTKILSSLVPAGLGSGILMIDSSDVSIGGDIVRFPNGSS